MVTADCPRARPARIVKRKSRKEYGARPKPGFKMGTGELEEIMFEKKRSNQEMMTVAESQPLPPKKLCFDAASLQDIGLDNNDLLDEEVHEGK
ncbi:unnamed protein product [Linum trigynum]|uniref:Uncharacterized protein n=1 Tax=Linum trigynum TaxID=586398 RepID=A0AAV2CMC4_9ROSI